MPYVPYHPALGEFVKSGHIIRSSRRNPNAYHGAHCLGQISSNAYPCAYKISKFRPQFSPIRITTHINMDDLLEAPHTVRTYRRKAQLHRKFFDSSQQKKRKSCDLDGKHRKNVHFCHFRVYPNPICRLRAERRLAQIDPMRFKFSNTAKEELPSKQNTICTLK